MSTVATTLSSTVIEELRQTLRQIISAHAAPKCLIFDNFLRRLVEMRLDSDFAQRQPENRSADVVLVIVGEICGKMNIHLQPEGVVELRAALNKLL